MAKRRANREGSVYQLTDGRWRAAISSEGRRVVFTAHTQGEVVDELTKAREKIRQGLPIGGKQTVGQFLAAWLEHTVKPSVWPKTYRSYEQMVRNHLAKTAPPAEWQERGLDSLPGLKDVPLSKLTKQRLQKFFADKLTAGNSPALCNYLRVVLRIALHEAVSGELIGRNVAALVKLPKVETREITPFTLQESARLLKAAMSHRLEALFTVGLAMGIRSGECSALRWCDVDFDAGKVHVRHTLQRIVGGPLTLMPTKSKKSSRTLDLPDSCITALRAHQVRQEQERQIAGRRWRETDHLFTTSIGTPIDDRKILKEFNSLTTAAKLPKQRFHDLRHACTSLLAAQGVPVKLISEILGHSDIRLTQNIYNHVYSEDKRGAADKMSALLTTLRDTPENPTATRIGFGQAKLTASH